MSKRTYTAEEIVEIVRTALAAKDAPEKNGPRATKRRCDECSSTDIRPGNDGPYCFDCYVDKKKADGKWREGGGR